MADARRLKALSMVPPLADEVARQINNAPGAEALQYWEDWDQIAEVDPHRFGAIGLTYDQLVAADGAGMDDVAASNDNAFDQANQMLMARGGGVIRYRGLIYPMSTTKMRGSNVRVEGVGPGNYFPRSAADKKFDGTIFLAYGTGPKVHTFPGITSGELNGGWRPDPENPGEHFKLWTAYNSDASGATPATLKQFSALILDDLADGTGGYFNIRALPWRGTDGVSDYLNPSAPIWGADWDFGYVIRNTEYTQSQKINCMGPWRQAGHALIICATPPGRFARAEKNLISDCLFEGRVGQMCRSFDVWKAVATTSNSVSVAWTSEHYWTNAGTFRGSDGGTYNYTSLTFDSGNLVFGGVTPSPSGILHIRHTSGGLAGTIYQNCMFYDLYPQDGTTAQDNGVMSSGVEISGFPLRGLKYDNSKIHVRGRVLAHVHQCSDLFMPGIQVEGGGYFIASPLASEQSWGPQATYETRWLRIPDSVGFSDGGADLTLFLPRNALVTELQDTPRDGNSGSRIMRALRAGQDYIIRLVTSGRFDVQKPDGSTALRVFPSGNVHIMNSGQLTFNGGNAVINIDDGNALVVRVGTTEIARININGARMSLVGPYADDAAAATAGVAVGQLYRLAGGNITWRQV